MRQREKLRQAAWEQAGVCSGNRYHPLNVSRELYRRAKSELRMARELGDRQAESQALNLCKEIKPVLQRMIRRTETAIACKRAWIEWDEHFIRGAA